LMAPLHCTGDAATRAIHAAFPTVTRDLHVGDTLTFS
jgi:metal-dependent hydrolase (beta-lactamase superfamily II)